MKQLYTWRRLGVSHYLETETIRAEDGERLVSWRYWASLEPGS